MHYTLQSLKRKVATSMDDGTAATHQRLRKLVEAQHLPAMQLTTQHLMTALVELDPNLSLLIFQKTHRDLQSQLPDITWQPTETGGLSGALEGLHLEIEDGDGGSPDLMDVVVTVKFDLLEPTYKLIKHGGTVIVDALGTVDRLKKLLG